MRAQRVLKLWTVLTVLLVVSAVHADEASAIAALKKVGGHVQTEGGGFKAGKPVIFVEILNDFAPNARDADLRHLKEFPKLRHLTISAKQITDAGLRELKDLKSVQRLIISSPKVTDSSLKDLSGLTSVKDLFLVHASIRRRPQGTQGVKPAGALGTSIIGVELKPRRP